MKRNFANLLFITILICSCQKEDIEIINSESESMSKMSIAQTNGIITNSTQTAINDEIIVSVAAAPSPNINGEVQLFLNKAVSYPINVHFKTESYKESGYNVEISNSVFVTPYYTIPAGQRYQICDIEDFFTTKIGADSISQWVYRQDLMIQICDVQTGLSNVNVSVNYSILKLDYLGNLGSSGLSVSYFLKAGTINLSELPSCSSTHFYGESGPEL